MEVVKRNGNRERVSFDKIIRRIEGVCKRLNLERIDPIEIAKETVQGLYNGITTEELDFFAANKCAEKILDDPEYNKLAAGLCISNLHKNTSSNFLKVSQKLYDNRDAEGNHTPLITREYLDIVNNNIDKISSAIDYSKDYGFDFFAVKTFERAYLIRLKNDHFDHMDKKKKHNSTGEAKMRMKKGKIIERPQHMIMRIALGIHGQDIDSAIETYSLISDHYFTHASPTLFNAGATRPQLSSCFLLGMDDNLNDIFETIADVSKISKWAGGIGIHLNDIRAANSIIRGTNGVSDGIIPLIKVLNEVGRYVNQGGRRNGAIAVYVEPWHADIYEFCDLRKNTGAEELRARDIFLALWVPSLFMKRVQENGMWSLMCPDECPGLTDTYGEEFEKLYTKYENEGKYRKQVKAEDLWFHILTAQIETGMPYMLYKDNVNEKSNQKNTGVIKSSNLCSEIVQYSDQNEIACCNLASICLPRYITTNEKGKLSYDFNKLLEVSQVVVKNLNKIIDINYYPVDKARKSNFKHRPIGIGVQGLADTYCMLDMPFDSDEAMTLNKQIFETIYYGCLKASNNLAKKYGPYETFKGSPFSEGKLQYHMWGLTEKDLVMNYDWASLIESIKQYGTRNSLLTALMPTASTSQLMNNNEAFEPYTTNLYTRTTLAGEYVVINRHLVEKLINMKLWTQSVKDQFMYDNGSIQKIDEIPDSIKAVFKTAFEMKSKPIVQQAIERGPFIDQTQSMNIFSNEPDFNMLTSSHFYGWKHGLKTGMYYLRSKPAVDPIKFGMDPETIRKIEKKRRNKSFISDSSDNYKNEISEEDTSERTSGSYSEGVKYEEEFDNSYNGRVDNYKECEMCSG
jgi:ribonucleoside-diphosphate reductase alpha chain